ncbi:MAG: acetone carboxylase subunit gamma, partial [Deltaproteobacteria bacterium]|nr:acetone carboxylase subunit gamma [Deltaproteobacteria bacterium]
MAEFHKADIEKLIDGVLPWPATQDMLKSPKDENRFDKYVEIMQERVEFDEPILLPLTPMLFIVSKDGAR